MRVTTADAAESKPKPKPKPPAGRAEPQVGAAAERQDSGFSSHRRAKNNHKNNAMRLTTIKHHASWGNSWDDDFARPPII